MEIQTFLYIKALLKNTIKLVLQMFYCEDLLVARLCSAQICSFLMQ